MSPMRRRAVAPRPDWQARVTAAGLTYHTVDGRPYWDESVCYEFAARDIATLEAATNELQRCCLEAAQHIITHRRYAELAIPPWAIPLIEWSWQAEPPSLYGRFDLAYDGREPPKLLEYNADTPTSLLEASVVQWFWLQETQPGMDQFNSIHDRLIAKWKDLAPHLSGSPLVFTGMDDDEDAMTLAYLEETARQAGLQTQACRLADLGWDHARGVLVDQENRFIASLFKLYPWEWFGHEMMVLSDFGPAMADAMMDATGAHGAEALQVIEPAWRMLWSNKGLLPILWELFPGHPNLLPAYANSPRELRAYAKKPLLSREGANVTLVTPGGTVSTDGEYGEEGFVYQALAPIPVFDGCRPVIGSWVVDGVSAGIGIRETDGAVTDNRSRFVPHAFR